MSIEARELINRMQTPNPPVVVDVRSGPEYRAGHIPGAVHAPAWRILLRCAPLPGNKETELIVTCEHGPRAHVASSLLRAAGYRNVTLLSGHMAGWRQALLPLDKQG